MLATDARLALEDAGCTCDIIRDFSTTKVNSRKMVLTARRKGIGYNSFPIVKGEVKAGDVETMVRYINERREALKALQA